MAEEENGGEEAREQLHGFPQETFGQAVNHWLVVHVFTLSRVVEHALAKSGARCFKRGMLLLSVRYFNFFEDFVKFVLWMKLWHNFVIMFRLTLKIHGKVQDVNFRWETKKLARELGLVGYVKNLPDGTVELVAEGEEEVLKKLLNYCKIGPRGAVVQRVDECRQEIEKMHFKDFLIEF